MIKFAASFILTLLFCLPINAQIQDAILGRGSGSSRNNSTGNIGFRFMAVTNVIVTDLGRYMLPGNTRTHTVRILSANLQILREVSVTPDPLLTNVFLFAPLTSPLMLTGGLRYFVYSQEASGGDYWHDRDQIIMENTTIISDMQSSYGNGLLSTGKAYGPPNFKFYIPNSNNTNGLRYDITLAWDPNSETNLIGYRLWHGADIHLQAVNTPNLFTMVDVGNRTNYTFTNFLGGPIYTFYATAYNSDGESRPSQYVQWIAPPQTNEILKPFFNNQPIGQSISVGSPITLSVAVTGTAPISLQWLKNGATIQGATSTVYNVQSAYHINQGTYMVQATNIGGTTLSSEALITVTNPIPNIVDSPRIISTSPN